jgi:ABC-type antimicrobial peptide transport system permease subunit
MHLLKLSLLAGVLLGGVFPALRASRIDPLRALRT